ncbi:MAG: pyruvate carboxyltransferase [Desulfobulbaceae bacterium]|nr:pyruvate carboxyltransferase [Desulfobulbaceae bacterium]
MQGLIDSTLREGGQMVGVNFTLAQKLAIVTQLDRLGIEEIELGVATHLDPELPALLAGARAAAITARLALWCRCREEDIEVAAQLNPDVLALSIPVSDLHIAKKLGKDRGWLLATLSRSIKLARDRGIGFISLGLEDATRAEVSFLLEVVATAAAAGADRVRLADTVGVATPAELADLVKSVQGKFPIAIGVHCHNDFGMATANSLAALEAGADWADVTVLGLGERAGNARLEEVAGFLALRRGRPYQVSQLRELAGLVGQLTGQPISPHQPLLGERIFYCESGLHLHGLHADPLTYEPYRPEEVGAERRWLYGGKIGKSQLRRYLSEAGFQATPGKFEALLQLIRSRLSRSGLPLGKNEFQKLVAENI